MTFRLGLTGSIGMGKTSTAQMFADLGCAVWDADAAVHRLYARSGAAVGPVSDRFPDALVDGAISRERLKTLISRDPDVISQLESIVHPLVREDRNSFAASSRAAITVFDIPLLFETGSDQDMNATVCVFVAPEIQRDRVLARGTMTQDQLDAILARQMPSDEKCARATYMVETDSFEHTREQVLDIYTGIMNRRKGTV